MRGPLEKTLTLEQPSPIAIACLKIEIAYVHYNAIIMPLTPSTNKMCTKLREEKLQCP